MTWGRIMKGLYLSNDPGKYGPQGGPLGRSSVLCVTWGRIMKGLYIVPQ